MNYENKEILKLIELNKLEEAYSKIRNSKGKDTDLLKVEILRRQGMTTEAKGICSLEEYKKDIDFRCELIRCMEEEGNIEGAIKKCKSFMKRSIFNKPDELGRIEHRYIELLLETEFLTPQLEKEIYDIFKDKAFEKSVLIQELKIGMLIEKNKIKDPERRKKARYLIKESKMGNTPEMAFQKLKIAKEDLNLKEIKDIANTSNFINNDKIQEMYMSILADNDFFEKISNEKYAELGEELKLRSKEELFRDFRNEIGRIANKEEFFDATKIQMIAMDILIENYEDLSKGKVDLEVLNSIKNNIEEIGNRECFSNVEGIKIKLFEFYKNNILESAIEMCNDETLKKSPEFRKIANEYRINMRERPVIQKAEFSLPIEEIKVKVLTKDTKNVEKEEDSELEVLSEETIAISEIKEPAKGDKEGMKQYIIEYCEAGNIDDDKLTKFLKQTYARKAIVQAIKESKENKNYKLALIITKHAFKNFSIDAILKNSFKGICNCIEELNLEQEEKEKYDELINEISKIKDEKEKQNVALGKEESKVLSEKAIDKEGNIKELKEKGLTITRQVFKNFSIESTIKGKGIEKLKLEEYNEIYSVMMEQNDAITPDKKTVVIDNEYTLKGLTDKIKSFSKEYNKSEDENEKAFLLEQIERFEQYRREIEVTGEDKITVKEEIYINDIYINDIYIDETKVTNEQVKIKQQCTEQELADKAKQRYTHKIYKLTRTEIEKLRNEDMKKNGNDLSVDGRTLNRLMLNTLQIDGTKIKYLKHERTVDDDTKVLKNKDKIEELVREIYKYCEDNNRKQINETMKNINNNSNKALVFYKVYLEAIEKKDKKLAHYIVEAMINIIPERVVIQEILEKSEMINLEEQNKFEQMRNEKIIGLIEIKNEKEKNKRTR